MARNHNNDREQLIKKIYHLRQTRQIIAIAAALFLVLFFAAVYQRPDLFGTYTKQSLFAAQAISIAAFVGFTFSNWRCPACGKRLNGDINRRQCKKCGAHLQ